MTAAIFAIGYFGGCILALARHPIFGLVTYVAVFYLHPPSRWWGSSLPELRWSLIAALVTLFAIWLHKPSYAHKPFFSHKVVKFLIFFVLWLGIQSMWALNDAMHSELVVATSKYVLLVFLIYKCIENEAHLRMFLWSHVGGCLYLGLLAFFQYTGGRFEAFGGPGINEANSAALQSVTGVLTAAALYLSGRLYEKLSTIASMPFVMNSIITTISRSGFLALAVAGVIFNMLAPKRNVNHVRLLSIVGLVLVAMLANPVYWERIQTIFLAGEEVEGVDTGAGRLVLVEAQFQMFKRYPNGCGHRCTVTLSPMYLDDKHLTGDGETGIRGRASHSTIMTLLVEQGLVGIILYGVFVLWVLRSILTMARTIRIQSGLIPNAFAATAASLGAIFIGDLFVDYLKYETRFWFVGLLLVVAKLMEFDTVSEDSGSVEVLDER